MTPQALALARFRAQRLAATTLDRPEEVVAWLGAVQAQDYLGALWAVGLRLRAATEATVEAALAERAVVRTWLLRGTLHLAAAADVRWLLGLVGPRAVAASAGRTRELGLDARTFEKAGRLLRRALAGGGELARPAALQVLARGGVSPAGQRGIHVLRHLALTGVLCLGARQGKQQTVALLDDRVPPARALPREEALARLARRYFTSRGPATLRDFAWWSGLPAADARAALALAGPGLVRREVGGAACWGGEAGGAGRAGQGTACLLPGFDELPLAYADRGAHVEPRHRERLHPGANGMLLPAVALGGRLVGTWRRTLARRGVSVEVVPFAPLGAAGERAVAAAIKRYARFLGVPVVGSARAGGGA